MKVGITSSVFVALVAVLVVATLVASMSVLPYGSTATVSNQTSASVASVDGLSLNLQISSTGLSKGGSLTINVTETNTRGAPLNESAAKGWALQGLRMNACYSSVFPFGVGVYLGHYTQKNISKAVPLRIFPLVPCPLFLRLITGYYFQANSDEARVLPGSGQSLPMTDGLVAKGNYTSGTNPVPFSNGLYTVAAGDEWGSVVLLYFAVASP